MKRNGIKIVAVKVVRYEVRTVDGKRMRSFASKAAANAWADGFAKAYDQLAPRAAKAAAKEPAP